MSGPWAWVLGFLVAVAPHEPVLSLRHVGEVTAAWPRPFVAELPLDFLDGGRRVALLGQRGEEVPSAVESLRSWSPGQPRWVRVQVGELPDGMRSLRLAAVRAPRPRAASTTIGAASGRVGAVQTPQGRFDWDDSELRMEPWAVEVEGCEVVTDGATHRFGRRGSRLLRGPDGSGVVLEGVSGAPSATDAQGPSPVELSFRWTLSSRGRYAELELTAAATEATVVRRWTMEGSARGPLDLMGSFESTRTRAGEHRIEAGRLRVDDPGGGVPRDLSLRSRGAVMVWREFGRRRPAAARWTREGRWRLDLVAGDVLLERGQRLRHHVEFHAVSRAPNRGWIVPADAWRGSGPDAGDLDWVDGWLGFLEQWLELQDQCEDRGCYPTQWGEWANGEYDLGGTLLRWGRRRGDTRALEIGLALVRHQRDFDRALDPPVGWPEGLFWMHGGDHRSERLEAGHVWARGLLEAVRVSGEVGALRDADGVGTALEQLLSSEEKLAGPERRLAWPLQAAIDWEPFDARGSGLAASLLDRLLQRQQASGGLGGDVRRARGRDVTWVNTWVSLGITAPALWRAAERLGRPEAGAAADRLASFVAREAADRRGWAEVVQVDPVLGEVIGCQGRCRAGNLALAALGLRLLARRGDSGLTEAGAAALWIRAREETGPPSARGLVDFAKALYARLEMLEAE